MLSGSSELWAAFPPACVNLQLDTSPFTCFSLGYPPLPPPLLPQPGSKLSEIRACFLSSCLSTPNQELQHCWAASPAPSHPSYPIPSYPHPIPSHPLPTPSHPPWPHQPWAGRGWPRCSGSSGGRLFLFLPGQCPSSRRDVLLGKRMESCFIWAPSFLSFFLSLSFFMSFSLSFPILPPPFPLVSIFFSPLFPAFYLFLLFS